MTIKKRRGKLKVLATGILIFLFATSLFLWLLDTRIVRASGPDNYFGWGGFIRTYDSVIPLLNELNEDGWNIVRYQSVPAWAQPDWGGFDIDHTILRHLIDEAADRNMYVMLNVAHNYPPGFYIDNHRQDWIDQYLLDVADYKNDENIILEIANEYGTNYESHQSEIVAHYNAMIAELRDEGFNQTIQCNFWWNQEIVALTDSENNYMCGKHLYAQSYDFDDYNTPGTYSEVCENSGIESWMDTYFNGTIQDCLDLGLNFSVTELGSGWDYKYTRGGVAFPMRFLDYAKTVEGVHVIMHRIGILYGDYDDYYDAADDYWSMSFFEPPDDPDDPPAYSNLGYNTTIAGNPVRFQCKWSDVQGLSGYIFGCNNTGTWTNETWSSLSGTEDWAYVDKTLNSTVGVTVAFEYWANDTIDQWSNTDTVLLTTTANVPQSSEVATNTTIAGALALHHVKWTDVEGLSGYIYGTNNTGTWQNQSWTVLTGTENVSDTTVTLNATVGYVVQWQIWANDTNDNWGDTGLQSLTLTEEGLPPYPPYVYYNSTSDTIFLWGGGTANLTWIDTYLSNENLLNETSSKVWWLNATIRINSTVTNLEVTSVDCQQLRINSPPTKVREIAWRGNLTFNNTVVYGWESGSPDTNLANGGSSLRSLDNSRDFYASNVTFAYLGNNSQAVRIHNAYYSSVISDCVFHNCSTLAVYSANGTSNLTDVSFLDMTDQDLTLHLQWVENLNATNLYFNNSGTLWLFSMNYTGGSRQFRNMTFQNQFNDDTWIIYSYNTRHLYFTDVTVNHCKNNSIYPSWYTVNMTFNNLWMNDTGLADYTGFKTQLTTETLTITDSTFYTINRVDTRNTVHTVVDNCTLYGNATSQYGFILGLNSTIKNSYVYNVVVDALGVKANGLIENNYVHTADCGIILHPGPAHNPVDTYNITVRGNTVRNCTTYGDAFCSAMKIGGSSNLTAPYTQTVAHNITVENNDLEGGSTGILLWRAENIVIRNNNISLPEWGTGKAHCPVGYGDGDEYYYNSPYRVTSGVYIGREFSPSWNWTIFRNFRCRNITLEDNTYDGAYMQAYVWIDKGVPLDDQVLTGLVDTDGFSTGYFRFEYTDSVFNGSICYANSDNPIYEYFRGNGTATYDPFQANATYHLSLNSTYFGTRLNWTGTPDITFTWHWSYFNCTFNQIQPHDNVTRYLLLQSYGYPNVKACAGYEGYDAYEMVYDAAAVSGTTSYWTVESGIFGKPTHIYINGVEDTSHWSFMAGNTTYLNWTHTSTVSFLLKFAPLNQYTPENRNAVITDMEGCGNWIFAEEQYYTWQATYFDANGYADLHTMKIKFTDQVHWVEAAYNGEWTLLNGSNIVFLQNGAATPIDPETLQVTFLFFLRNEVIDSLNVDLWLWCNDSAGNTPGWENVAADYVNIYNLGGLSTMTTSGTAGRLAGGDVFDLYAHNNSWVNCYMVFRDLQHVKMLPTILIGDGFPYAEITFYWDYCIADDWETGWRLTLDPSTAYMGANRYWNFSCEWYNSGSLVKNESIHVYWEWMNGVLYGNLTTQLWFDFWINKVNASSVAGGRVNAYYFPMKDSANNWLRWLTGSNWGVFEELRKQSMFFDTMLNANGNVVYSQQIKLIRFGICLNVTSEDFGYLQITDYDVFDLTQAGTPLRGIQTPVFDETKVPVMPQGGFLGAIVSGLHWLGKYISENILYGGLNLWGMFVGFLDTIAGWLGFPNAFSNFILWLGSLWNWLGTSFTYLITYFTAVFSFIYVFMGKFLNLTATTFTNWANMFGEFFNILGGAYEGTVNLWTTLNIPQWIQLAIIVVYPLYLLVLWEERGLDAVIAHLRNVIDVFAFIGRLFIGVIQLFLNVIGRIIESIPVVE